MKVRKKQNKDNKEFHQLRKGAFRGKSLVKGIDKIGLY